MNGCKLWRKLFGGFVYGKVYACPKYFEQSNGSRVNKKINSPDKNYNIVPIPGRF